MPPEKPKKKNGHWLSHGRCNRKTDTIQDRLNEVNLMQLHFNTKRANSVLEENFLHPIVVPPPPPEPVNGSIAIEVPPKQRRRSLFGNSIKKKIGPMEEKTRTGLFSRRSLDEKSSGTEMHSKSNGFAHSSDASALHSSINSSDIDEEQGDFVMSPTLTDDMTNLHPTEVEARRILERLGITSEMLCRAIESGPRSDIIGAYRIVIYRLQRQKLLAKANEQSANEVDAVIKPKPNRRNNNRSCAIL